MRTSTKEARMRQDEEELEALMKAHRKEDTQETQETEEAKEVEETPESKEDRPLSKEEETFKKRYGDLRAHMSAKEKEWEAKFAKLESQLKNQETAPLTEDEVKAWIKDNPVASRIVTSLAEQVAEERMSSVKAEVDELQSLRKKAARDQAYGEIRKAHPDFDKIKESDEFHDWAEDQPKWVKDSLYDNPDDPRAVIRVLELYKLDKGLTPKDLKQKEKEAAGLVGKTSKADVSDNASKKAFSESQVARMSDKEYAEKEADILKSMRDGTFIYDVSGAAR